jgi:hypothetical protein
MRFVQFLVARYGAVIHYSSKLRCDVMYYKISFVINYQSIITNYYNRNINNNYYWSCFYYFSLFSIYID